MRSAPNDLSRKRTQHRLYTAAFAWLFWLQCCAISVQKLILFPVLKLLASNITRRSLRMPLKIDRTKIKLDDVLRIIVCVFLNQCVCKCTKWMLYCPRPRLCRTIDVIQCYVGVARSMTVWNKSGECPSHLPSVDISCSFRPDVALFTLYLSRVHASSIIYVYWGVQYSDWASDFSQSAAGNLSDSDVPEGSAFDQWGVLTMDDAQHPSRNCCRRCRRFPVIIWQT